MLHGLISERFGVRVLLEDFGDGEIYQKLAGTKFTHQLIQNNRVKGTYGCILMSFWAYILQTPL